MLNVALDEKDYVANPSQERCQFLTRAHMYYCMYFYPNVNGLKLVKHRVIFLSAIECLHLSDATFIKTILYGPKAKVVLYLCILGKEIPIIFMEQFYTA